ncbi:MAG TPA: hypothetical protein VFY10_13025 [Dehalococcoidia bacterium]|nr:hypothetical protein [Dehalococcoidia bacterium]
MLVLLCLPMVAFLAVGCLAPSNYQQIPPPTPTAPDRTDCGQILGTAFRSEAEEAWFSTNCSAWEPQTLGRVADASGSSPPAAASASPTAATQPEAGIGPSGPNAQRCDQLRGQPYSSSDDHAWFLANCLATPASSQPSDAPGLEACDQLGGTIGLTQAELAWFRANCNQAPR